MEALPRLLFRRYGWEDSSKLARCCVEVAVFWSCSRFFRSVDQSVLLSKGDSQAIAHHIYIRDVVSIVNDTHTLFSELITTKRGDIEPFDNYESQFVSKFPKFSTYALSTRPCEALYASLFLGNAHVDNAQKISILFAFNGG